MYITTKQTENINFKVITKNIKCNCGDTYSILIENDEFIVCDACHENAPNKEKFFEINIKQIKHEKRSN